MPSALDLERATRIAEEYLERLNTNGEFQVILRRGLTLESEFGCVFFWGPSDPLILVARKCAVDCGSERRVNPCDWDRLSYRALRRKLRRSHIVEGAIRQVPRRSRPYLPLWSIDAG
jgi:hypothetical protein